MSSTTGKQWVVGRYDGVTPYNIGAIVEDVKIKKGATVTKEAGTGQRKLASIDSSGVYWVINIKAKLQILAQFVTSYAFVTAEGTLPSFNLYTYDGITKKGFTSCYVNTCKIEFAQQGAIYCTMQIYALGTEDKDLSVTVASEVPMTKAAVTTLTLGGTSLTKWIQGEISINNNIGIQSTGNGVTATEIWAQEATYSGSIMFVKTAALAYGYSTSVALDLVLTLTDNQSSPAAVTFTFDDVRFTDNNYGTIQLKLTIENVVWEGDELVIS